MWKSKVDAAINRCKEIGTIVNDIRLCGFKARSLQPSVDVLGNSGEFDVSKMLERAAARRLGAHYLMRYFLLIAFRGFLDHWLHLVQKQPQAEMPRFHDWFGNRKELYHLLDTLQLE